MMLEPDMLWPLFLPIIATALLLTQPAARMARRLASNPVWALAGGGFAVFQFGPLSQWMNSYWGGAVAGIAGCLIFGALPRLRSERFGPAMLLGAGLGLSWLTRPFETALASLSILLYFVL